MVQPKHIFLYKQQSLLLIISQFRNIIQLEETSMSIVASTAQEICHSPTNQSKAKMLFTFTKSPRFPKNKENQCDQFYEINKKGIQRATNLGYGKKYDFTKDSPITPAPGVYQTETLFQHSKKKNKGFGFGSGRGEMEATGLIKKNQNPGPGAYQAVSQRSAIYSSMKGKNKIDDRELRYVPGPGSYQASSTFNKTGHIFTSRFKNRSACRFNKEQRFKNANRKVPGPGAYDSSKTQFSPEGKYFFSRLQSAKSSKFGKSLRSSQNRCQTPGPGNYRLPSQFGYYVSRSAFNQVGNTFQNQV